VPEQQPVYLSDRDLSALRFAANFIRGYEDSLDASGGESVVGRREGEATSDVLAAIVSRAELGGDRA
jgi:hypothetical protein